MTAGLFLYNLSVENKLEKELYVLTGGIAAFGICQIVAGALHRKKNTNGFVEVMDDLNFLPATMKDIQQDLKNLQLKNMDTNISDWEKSQMVSDIISKQNRLEKLYDDRLRERMLSSRQFVRIASEES